VASFLSVSSALLVGIILVVAPWTTLWDSNYLLNSHPLVRAFVLSSFTRGTVTGLGLVNIAIAVWEARQHLSRGGEHA
jgi:hypothetical protein